MPANQLSCRRGCGIETFTVASEGHIVIPRTIREAQHIEAGAEFVIVAEGDGLRLKPVPLFPVTRVEDGLGMLHKPGRRPPNDADVKHRIGGMPKAKDEATQR